MNKFKVIAAVVAIAAIAVVAAPKVANAIVGNTNTAECRLDAKTPIVFNETTKKYENLGKNFTFSADGKKATGTFVVSGTNANCKKDVTFASWTMPKAYSEAGYQLKDQKLFDYTIARGVGRGTHTITVDLPQCSYWQIDMLEGTQPTGDDGTADYGFGKAHMLDTVMGGKKCTTTPEKPEVCPYDPKMEKGDPNCKPAVTPETPKTPTTPTKEVVYTKSSPVKEVPNTGAGSVLAGTMGASSSAGLAYSYLQSRRKLKALK